MSRMQTLILVLAFLACIVLAVAFWLRPFPGDHAAMTVALVVGLASLTGLCLSQARFSRDKAMQERAERKNLLQRTSDLEATFELAAIGIAHVSRSGHWLLVNPEYARLLGYSQEELTSMTFQDVTHPEDVEADLRLAEQLWSGAIRSSRMEKRYIRKSGEIVWALLSSSLVRSEQGEPRHFIATALDITERKRIEEALKLSEERLRLSLDASRLGFFDWDLENNSVHFSSQMLEDWGIAEDTPHSLESVLALIHPADRDEAQRRIAEGLAGSRPYHVEYRVIRPADLKEVWVEVKGEVRADAHGKPIRFVGTCLNITERKRTLERLLESEARFRLFAEAMPQMAFVADPDGNIIYLNQRHRDYFGHDLSEHIGWGWAERRIHHPDDLQRTISTWQESLRTGNTYELEYRLLRADGEYRWHLARAVPVRDAQGRIVLWLGTNTDIHEQKIVQERLRLSEEELRAAKTAAENARASKSTFLSHMSHEIRTPLSAILGFSDLMATQEMTAEERKETARIIRTNGEELSRLLDDILDLAKVEAGRLQLEKVRVDPGEVLDEVLRTFEAIAARAGVRLLRGQVDVPHAIVTDPTRVRQVLRNLVSNGIKFTPAGGQVSISAVHKASFVEFSVSDTGIGLSDEQRAHLFRPFTQADASTRRRFGGTGLGLALSLGLARALGGDLALAESVPERGSTFVFRLPAAQTESGGWIDHGRKPASPVNLDGLRVLLAEDLPDNALLLRKMLEPAGVLIHRVEDGQQAVEAALTGNFDVVLMDVMMPVKNGLDATRELRARGFRKPIVALTAHALREERQASFSAGCDAHLSKPVRRNELFATLCRVREQVSFHGS